MKTGIIFEIDEEFLTLLTPDGQFLRARNEAYQYKIGQEIQFVPMEEAVRKPMQWFQSFKMKAIFAAAVVMLIGAGTLIPVYQNNQVYAYMSLDDGSSIELEMNEDLQVIGIVPFNKEGEQIAESISDWKKQDVSIVSEKIVTEMKKQRVGDGEIVLSSTTIEEKNKEANERLKKKMSDIHTVVNKNNSTMKVVEGTKAEREKAINKGVTLGQYKEKETVKAEKQYNNNAGVTKSKQPKKEQKNNDKSNHNIPSSNKTPAKENDNRSNKNEKYKRDKETGAEQKRNQNKDQNQEKNKNQNQDQRNNRHQNQEYNKGQQRIEERSQGSSHNNVRTHTENRINQNRDQSVNRDRQDRSFSSNR